MCFLIGQNHAKKGAKAKEMVKKELLDFIIEHDEVEEPGLGERVQSITDIAKAITVINKYDEVIGTQNKKIINTFDNENNFQALN